VELSEYLGKYRIIVRMPRMGDFDAGYPPFSRLSRMRTKGGKRSLWPAFTRSNEPQNCDWTLSKDDGLPGSKAG
jgi:hypothetical protein